MSKPTEIHQSKHRSDRAEYSDRPRASCGALDLTTLRVLEEALETFAGSAIIISHDRFFLDRLANSLVIYEDNQQQEAAAWPRVFNGNFEYYFEVHQQELEAAGVNPGKYRKTTYRKMHTA